MLDVVIRPDIIKRGACFGRGRPQVKRLHDGCSDGRLGIGTARNPFLFAEFTRLAMKRITSERAKWLADHVLPHEPSLRSWLASKRLHGIDTDDIVQETYALLAALESVDAIRHVKAYMFKTAYSVILGQVRRANVVSISTIDDIGQLAGADEAPSPEVQVSDRQELQKLSEAIASLPARRREVFVLRKVHGLKQREVAQKLGVSEGTVEKQMQKSLNALMAVLGRGGYQHRQASKLHGARSLVRKRDA